MNFKTGSVMEERRRKYYSIGEVAEMMKLKPHILRYWETEFSMLRPRKNRAGNRAYTERDIKIVRLIKHLLYDEKFTIEGARQRIKTNRDMVDEQLSLPFGPEPEQDMQITAEREDILLHDISREISEIIGMVEKI